MDQDQERKNQVMGILTSLGVHAALIALFLFVMGFTAPNPPLGEQGSGVELQLGVDDQGSGDVQQETPISPTEEVSDEQKSEEAKQQEKAVEEQVKADTKPVVEDKPKEDLSADEESPVVVKEVKKEPKKIEPPKEKVVVEKPIDVPVKAAYKEEKKEVKSDAKESSTGKKNVADNSKSSKGISQGDDKGKVGDIGVPEGVPSLKAQYSGKAGTGGAGGGGSGGISVSGFSGFDRPDIAKPEIPDDSYGIYEFEVSVNSQGEIEGIKTINRGTNLEAEKIFKKIIQNLEFNPNKSSLPPSTKGTIKFTVVEPNKK